MCFVKLSLKFDNLETPIRETNTQKKQESLYQQLLLKIAKWIPKIKYQQGLEGGCNV